MRKSISQVSDICEFQERFYHKLSLPNETGCMEWCGSIGFHGYGQLCYGGKTWAAHRVAYEFSYGPIDKSAAGWWVLHKCDNPACCNPEHLYLGTPKQNALDCANRKRQSFGYRDISRKNEKFGTVFYEFQGEIKSLKEWSMLLNVNASTLDQRFLACWPEEDISMSSSEYKRHQTKDCVTTYKRFSGEQEVHDYMNDKAVIAKP